MGDHSLWAPSAGKAWRTCAGYPVMNEGAPRESSVYAAEGTAYHGVAERAFTSGAPCATEVGRKVITDGFPFVINEEDADYAQVYVDRLRARADAGCIVRIEQKADTSEVLGIPEQSGTIDGEVIDLGEQALEIDDLKFGKGIRVYVWKDPNAGGVPEGYTPAPRWSGVNDQLAIYGVARWRLLMKVFGLKRLKLAIHQPRLDHYDEIVLNAEEVEQLAAAIYVDAQHSHGVWKTYREDAMHLGNHLTPSLDACRWCFRAGSCKVRASHIMRQFPTREQLKYAVEIPVTAKNLPTLSGPELAKALDKVEEIQNWCRAVQAEALQRAEAGSPDKAPGWKLGEGRKGDRTADPEAVLIKVRSVVGDAPIPAVLYTEPELKSVAQVEKACKKLGAMGKAIWAAIAGTPGDETKGIPAIPGIITQAEGRRTLVRDFDARPELAPQATDFALRPADQEFTKPDASAGLL